MKELNANIRKLMNRNKQFNLIEVFSLETIYPKR